MRKKQTKPLVLVTDRLKVLTTIDLQKAEGGTGIPPKLITMLVKGLEL